MQQSSNHNFINQHCFKPAIPSDPPDSPSLATEKIQQTSFLICQVQTLKPNCEARLVRRGRRGRVEERQWSSSEQQKLLQLHNAVGNRWSYISSCLVGRTDNSVKNHFFARLRMALRYLYQQLGERIAFTKAIQVQSLYKIISVYDEAFKEKSSMDPELIRFSADLKNRIFNYFFTEQTQDHVALQLAKDIYQFSTHFHKRKRHEKHPDLSQGRPGQCPYSQSDEQTIEKISSISPNRKPSFEDYIDRNGENQQIIEEAEGQKQQYIFPEDDQSLLKGSFMESSSLQSNLLKQEQESSPFIHGSNPFLSFKLILSPDCQCGSLVSGCHCFYPSDSYSPFLLFDCLRGDSERD